MLKTYRISLKNKKDTKTPDHKLIYEKNIADFKFSLF